MIVIKRKQRIHHTGHGLGSIFKRLTSKFTKEGTKKAIKRVVDSAIAHKVSDAVVKGALGATEKLVEDTLIKQLKRKPQEEEDIADGSSKQKKKKKVGFGIIFD